MSIQDNNDSDKQDLESSVGMVVFLVLFLAIPAGFGLLQLAEMIWPSLNERWDFGSVLLGLVCASGAVFLQRQGYSWPACAFERPRLQVFVLSSGLLFLGCFIFCQKFGRLFVEPVYEAHETKALLF